jgi:hypothetical protein
MSSSNISSVTKTADAAAISGRTRVVGIYYTCTNTGSSFSLKNGSTSGGTALVSITTPGAAGGYDMMTGAGGVGGRTLFQLNADAALGSFTNALKAITVYGASGSTSGLGSAFVAEMTLSAGTSSGTYAPLEIELNAPTGASTGTRTSFIYASTQGAGVATVDDNAVFFNLQGVTAGAGHLLVAGTTLGTAYGGLRVRVGNANYWVPLYAAEPT